MMTLTYNIQGPYVEDEGFNVVDRTSNRPEVQWIRSNVKQTPDGRALMLTPVQETSAWATAGGKLGLGDYTFATAAGWEVVEQRGTADNWIQSRGTANGPCVVNALPAVNQGMCLEIQAIAAAKTLPDNLYVWSFGTYFTLNINGDGTAELWDSRVSAAAVAAGQTPIAVAKGRIAPGDVTGKYVAITVLPMPMAGCLLVYSSLGPWFSANVGAANTPDPTDPNGTPGYGLSVVTQSDVVTITPLSGQKALFQYSVLQFPAAGSLTSPAFTPPTPIDPTRTIDQTLLAASEFLSTATLTLNETTDLDGDITTIGYTVALTSSDLAQTPFVYKVMVEIERGLSNQTYTSDPITGIPGAQGMSTGGIIEAGYEMSRDRAQDSATFTLDNPTVDGVQRWGSIAILQNRGACFFIDVARDDSGAPTAAGMLDPDWPMVRDWGGGNAIAIFPGYSTTAEYTDAAQSTVRVTCDGPRKKLRKHLAYTETSFDGWLVSAAFVYGLQQCGFRAPWEADLSHPSEIYVVDNGTTLDNAQPGSVDDRWQPADGVCWEDLFSALCDYGGYEYAFIQGSWFIVPLGWFGLNQVQGLTTDPLTGLTIPNVVTIDPTSVPLIHRASPANGLVDTGPAAALPLAAFKANPGVEHLAALGKIVQSAQEMIASVVVVIGLDYSGNYILAVYEDEGAISDPTALNYCGDRWLFLFSNSSISTQAVANAVCGKLIPVLTNPTLRTSVQLPDLVPQLGIGGFAQVEGFWYGNVTDLKVKLAGDGLSDRYRLSDLTVQQYLAV